MWPVLNALRTSLFDDSLVGGASWAGLENYRELLGDPNFWAAMWHTALFTLLSVPPLVLLPMGLALLVSRVSRLQWLFRLAFFAPYVLPVSVVVLVWNWLYQPGFGLINSYLTALGMAEVNWLGQPGVAMVSAVIATVWWTLGFNFVLYLAGLQEIPRELYEAAATDGAEPGQQIRHITLPLLSLDDRARHDPAGDRLAEGLRSDLPAPARHAGAGELDPAGDPVHLRGGLHAVPDRLRERDVVRVLPCRRGRGADLAVARAPRRHADGDLEDERRRPSAGWSRTAAAAGSARCCTRCWRRWR